MSVLPSTETVPRRLHVLVIGAGLFGLGSAISIRLAGHDVTVLESVPSLEEVGAGLQITPNGTRILKSWGVDKLLSAVTAPATFSMRRFDGSRILAHRPDYGIELENRYGSPLWCLHRAQLQQALASRAESLGAEIRLNARVSHVDPDKGTVELESGETVQGQLIVGADGLWSTTRAALFRDSLDKTPLPLPTGDLAYRIIIDRDRDQDVNGIIHERFFKKPGIHIWVGPGSHAVAYSMLDGRYLNIVLLVPDNLPPHVAKAEGDLNEMHALFRDWDPILAVALQKTDRVLKWRLHHRKYRNCGSQHEVRAWTYNPVVLPLPRWFLGRYVIGGDCAHPMLPYMAQGANSSLEDAATIGALLSHVTGESQVPSALSMFDAVRRKRVDQLVRETFAQGEEHHLPDGDLQQQRDERLARSMMPEFGPESEVPWTHPKIQPWVYGYDAYREAEEAFTKNPF